MDMGQRCFQYDRIPETTNSREYPKMPLRPPYSVRSAHASRHWRIAAAFFYGVVLRPARFPAESGASSGRALRYRPTRSDGEPGYWPPCSLRV